MECTVIKIEKEIVDWPESREPFMTRGIYDPPWGLDDNGLCTVTTEMYQLHEVRTPLENTKRYFVKIDDHKLFNELIEISKQDLEKFRSEAVKKAWSEAYREGQRLGIDSGYRKAAQVFLSMPWYKRLLINFYPLP